MAGDWRADYDDNGYQAKLTAYAEALLDLRMFWPSVVNLWTRWMGKQFKSEGAYWNGYPWAPLSPAYAAWKAEHYPGKGILVAEGDLRRGAVQAKADMTPRYLVMTVEWPKAPNRYTAKFSPAWHHYGEGHNPVRPLLQEEYLNPEQTLELADAAEDYAERVAKTVGL